ncbi:MAG: diacylglycerol kinase family lipid kinase [Bacteroidales bacterium]|nr:diacylglycerol kinase family lipid kinase [Bacteroidales bacterium]
MKRTLLLIVNPISGGKDKTELVKIVKESVDSSLYEISTVYTEYAGHASELAVGTDADVVVAIGGDGTQNEVARSLVGTDKVMGIIPCGSGDGLALHLGISRKPAEAAALLNKGEVATMDYGLFEGHPFFCTAGMGIDALVSWKFAEAGSRGLRTYVSESAKAWFGFKPDAYRVCVDGEMVYDGPATLVTVGNANQWGNNARITAKASVTDGELDVCVVEPFRTWAFPGLLWHLMGGTSFKSRYVKYFRGKQIRIERSAEGPVHFDGDPYQMGREIGINVVPAALKVIVPNKHSI